MLSIIDFGHALNCECIKCNPDRKLEIIKLKLWI